jgi:hypothetical protein
MRGLLRDDVVEIEAVNEDLNLTDGGLHLVVIADVSHEVEVGHDLHEHDGVGLACHILDVLHAPPYCLG